MRATEPTLFDPDDWETQPSDRSLVIRAPAHRPLSKEERAFNRALAQVQTLGRAIESERRRLDDLLVFHAAEIRPRIARAVAARTAVIRAMMPFLDDRRLTVKHRRVLRRILITQLDDVLANGETPEPDLQALFERLHDVSYTQAVQDQMTDARAEMAAMFEDLGLDIDVPALRADMTEEDVAATAARLADELRRAGEARDGAQPPPGRGKVARAAEERARRQAQLRKDSLGAVYRRLVKCLHPDLEPDPTERGRKNRVMQEITAAHARGDLRALLGLELEWIAPSGGSAATPSHETLRSYAALLKAQAVDLRAELDALPMHPRYAALLVEGPFGFPGLVDGSHEVARLDMLAAQLDAAVQRLSTRDALREVRDAIREFGRGPAFGH